MAASRPVYRQKSAERDIEAAAEWYTIAADAAIAEHLSDAVEATILHIAEYPSLGSQRHAEGAGSPPLRHRRLPRDLPYLVFYVETEHYIEIWRVPHERRDMPPQLG